MADGILYSVIVPVYNGAATLRRCLDSLLRDRRQDVEVLAVDDGSSDGSGGIIREYARKDLRVRGVFQENAGASAARNAGLEAARGEYILFSDCDDCYSPACFSLIDEKRKAGDWDLLQLSMAVIRNGAVAECGQVRPQKDEWVTDIPAAFARGMRSQTINSSCGKVFRRSLIGNRRFCEDLWVGEDLDFVLACGLRAKTMLRGSEVVYYISVDNENSLSRRPRPELEDQFLLEYRMMARTVDGLDLPEEKKEALKAGLAWVFYRNAYSVAMDARRGTASPGARRKRLSRMCGTFSGEQIRPRDLKCALIALPVRLKLGWLLDGIAGAKEKLKRRG